VQCRLSMFSGKQAKGRHAKPRQMMIMAGFCMTTFHPARQRYDKQKPKTQRMECRVLSCGRAKSRHAKPRNIHLLTGFRVAPFRLFAPKTRLYDMAEISHHIIKKPLYQVVCLETVTSIIHISVFSHECLN